MPRNFAPSAAARAENAIRARQAARRYSCGMPPRRSRSTFGPVVHGGTSVPSVPRCVRSSRTHQLLCAALDPQGSFSAFLSCSASTRGRLIRRRPSGSVTDGRPASAAPPAGRPKLADQHRKYVPYACYCRSGTNFARFVRHRQSDEWSPRPPHQALRPPARPSLPARGSAHLSGTATSSTGFPLSEP